MSIRDHRAILALGSIDDHRDVAHGLCDFQRSQGPSAFVMPAPPRSRGNTSSSRATRSTSASTTTPTTTRRTCWCGRTARSACPSSAKSRRPASRRPQLAEEIAQRSSANLRDPKVSVNVQTMNPTRIFVGGEVVKPGFVDYTAGMTAVQAIIQVGGWKDTADLEEVVLLQKVSENTNEYRPSKINVARSWSRRHQGRHRPRALGHARRSEDGHRQGQSVDAAVRHQHDPDPDLGDARSDGRGGHDGAEEDVGSPMYAQFYGLRESPFALTPDPRYLFMSEAAQGGARLRGLRGPGAQGLRADPRRGRHGQDHAHPPSARAVRSEYPVRLRLQSRGQLRRAPAAHAPGSRAALPEPAARRDDRHAERLPAEGGRGRALRGRHHRRGPAPVPRRARGSPDALESRDGAGQAHPDPAGGPARARARSSAAPSCASSASGSASWPSSSPSATRTPCSTSRIGSRWPGTRGPDILHDAGAQAHPPRLRAASRASSTSSATRRWCSDTAPARSGSSAESSRKC